MSSGHSQDRDRPASGPGADSPPLGCSAPRAAVAGTGAVKTHVSEPGCRDKRAVHTRHVIRAEGYDVAAQLFHRVVTNHDLSLNSNVQSKSVGSRFRNDSRRLACSSVRLK